MGRNARVRMTRFRDLRVRMGLTQAELAELLSKDRKTVNRYERGHRGIPGTVEQLLRRIAGERRVKYPK